MRMLNLRKVNIGSIGDAPIITRTAVKGITLQNDRVLLLKTKAGEYKFPGGGQEHGENDCQTLQREYREEVGRAICEVGELLYTVTELSRDKFDPSCFFQMISRYYLCSVGDKCVERNLDLYERELAMSPVFVEIDTAIRTNLDRPVLSPWTERETCVLRELEKDLRTRWGTVL